MVEATEVNMEDPGGTKNIEAEVAALAQPDEELLVYQQQKSLPRLSLTGITVDGPDENILEDIDLCDSPDHVTNQYGMMQAGGEEQVIIKLIKAGSLDPDALADSNSPEGRLHADMEAYQNDNEEEKKETQ